ncbi:15430_t:CDS:2 [Gigaspora margarita]|uniref:15430_t:CDS:1 n=1 Tax=Gigaspora margarita TaxID=4874 RepID=A0ABN7VUL7_GIGMA|nr:15430_t:CDS:2 [Gigaspora margarita]
MNSTEEITQLKKYLEILNNEINFREQIIEGLEANINRFELKCTICFEHMSNPCTILCGHTFCYKCLYQWDIIYHFVSIKSSAEIERLKKEELEVKFISNKRKNLFNNPNTETKCSYEDTNDNYDTSDSFIDDEEEEADNRYTDEYTDEITEEFINKPDLKAQMNYHQ